MSVIILSTTDNQRANSIQNEFENDGTTFLRFNFSSSHQAVIGFYSGNNGQVLINGNLIRSEEVSGIFVHHPFPPSFKFQGSDMIDSSLLASGWRNAMDWFEEVFNSAIWINKPSKSRIAASILLQLNVAESCGMSVPNTIFTNDFSLLKSFASRQRQIAIKSGPLLGVNLEGHRLLTNVVDVGEIREEQLAASPCLFQEYIEKAFELRIHVVGDTVLACRNG